ncbi:WD repeat WDR12/Ytm1, partial [Trinorchestia longiramus]
MSDVEHTNEHEDPSSGKKRRARRKMSKKKLLQQLEVKPTKFLTVSLPEEKMEEDKNVLITFYTKQQMFAVPKTSYTVPEDTDPEGLNKMLTRILEQSALKGSPPAFDFLVNGVMLHGPLCKFLADSEETSREGGLIIEYLEQQPPPIPKDVLNHDDWVAALHFSKDKLLITGCYDKTIHIWRPNTVDSTKASKILADDEEAHLLTIPDAHKDAVKAISWVPKMKHCFISGGMDQSVRMWQWDSTTNKVRCIYKCRGHTQSVESMAVAADGHLFATGSWDGALKIWSTNDEGVIEASGEPEAKKSRSNVDPPKNKGPQATLSNHTQSVSGLVWPTLRTLASCSWDNSVRLWDVEAQIATGHFVGPCASISLDSSPFNNTILFTSMDSRIRLLDPRSGDGMVLEKTFQHHKRWANSVKWSPSNEYHFASGGFDNVVKLWDVRSCRSPLFEMMSHDDKVLAIDWSAPGVLFSGSADCNVKVFLLPRN